MNNERSLRTDQLRCAASLTSSIDDYQQRIEQLRDVLTDKDAERTLLVERIDAVERDLRMSLDERAALSVRCETLRAEHETIIREKTAELQQR
jgi:hypothetical protein